MSDINTTPSDTTPSVEDMVKAMGPDMMQAIMAEASRQEAARKQAAKEQATANLQKATVLAKDSISLFMGREVSNDGAKKPSRLAAARAAFKQGVVGEA